MHNDIVIRADGISKKFCRGLKHVMFYGVQDIARNTFGMSSNSEMLREGEFWAVNDISFEVKKGETLGIIGANGSGKTTLLKLLNGIFMPDKGRIEIKGKVGALIEVGAGFHPMLTGRENIYVNGSILGMSKKEIDKKFDEIVDFADIGDFLDAPVKHYSSGMYVRLGFAVAVHCKQEILLIDEVLAVGDMAFQRKCHDKMKDMKKNGISSIFVSHNMYSVEGICDSVLFLNGGRSERYGDDVAEIVAFYEEMVLEKKSLSAELRETVRKGAFENRGTGEIKVVSLKIMNGDFKEKRKFSVGERIHFEVEIESSIDVENPIYSMAINRIDGVVCGVHRTYFDKIIPPKISKGRSKFRLILNNQLNSGEYFIVIAVSDKDLLGQLPYCWRQMEIFTVVNPPAPNVDEGCGVFFPRVKWEFLN